MLNVRVGIFYHVIQRVTGRYHSRVMEGVDKILLNIIIISIIHVNWSLATVTQIVTSHIYFKTFQSVMQGAVIMKVSSVCLCMQL